MTVLITRPEPDARRFADQCRAEGLDTVTAPLMTIRHLDDWTPPPPDRPLAFTSANGVRAFAARTAHRNATAFCVGPASAAEALHVGFESVIAAEGHLAALAATIAQSPDLGAAPIVHIAGTRRAGDLVALLAEKDIAAERLVAYATEEATSIPSSARDAIVATPPPDTALFSPRTATLFVQLAKKDGLAPMLSHIRAICLSEAVADAASGVGWAAICVAQEPTTEAMLAILRRPA